MIVPQRLPHRKRRSSAVLAALILLGSTSLQGQGRKPPRYGEEFHPATSVWIKEGRRKKLRFVEKSGKRFLPVPQLSRLATAQLRWKSVSQEVCLSRVNGLLCFDWKNNAVLENGKRSPDTPQIVFTDNQLFVGEEFIYSETFQRFTQTRIAKTEGKIYQRVPENLAFQPVAKRADHYLITVTKLSGVETAVLEKSAGRVWVRFKEGRFGSSKIMEGDQFVKAVRIKQRQHSADMVISLGRSAFGARAEVEDSDTQLSVWIPTAADAEPKFVPAPAAVGLAPALAKRTDLKPVDDGLTRTIVIDAGHGGIDSGAIGTRGTLEKDINLKVALALADQLKKEKGVRVILTRQKDEFLALSERTAIANKVQADLFVSVHCNSSINSKASGFEVYLLSPEATDEAAASVARLENSVVALEAGENGATSKAGELLASMAVNNYINESSECAGHVCMGIKRHSPVRKTSVKEANFYVLRGAQMPSILLELEYLSNPVTELKLRSSRFRSQITKGIAKGLIDYDRHARQKISSSADKKRLSMNYPREN